MKEKRALKSGMVVTDLDGTLLHTGGTINRSDRITLEKLGNNHILRVIATGRSLFSARRALEDDLPIDYLIFSSGAGITEWHSKNIIEKHNMTKAEVELAAVLLLQRGIDFMIHEPIPNNHSFTYYGNGKDNPDFIRRIDYYREFAIEGNTASPAFKEACQLVAIEPYNSDNSVYQLLKQGLHQLKVIRTTSPMDGKSTWIELFPRSVSKSRAAEYLSLLHTIRFDTILAVGNDYNDIDLLSWAPASYVVDTAPDELKASFESVRDGFTEAVERWLRTMDEH